MSVATTTAIDRVPGAGQAPPLGRKALRGALWTVGCAIVIKGVSFGSQVVLAWFLVPEDVGLAAMASSIAALSWMLSANSLHAVLIQKQERFDELAAQVFWLGLVLHTLAGGLTAALAPLAGLVYRDGRLVAMVLLLAAGTPLYGLPLAYTARLYIRLQFRTITAIQMTGGVLQAAGSIGLAAAGFGPYALLVPPILVQLYAVAAYRLAAGPVPPRRVNFRLWPGLLASGIWLMLQSLVNGLRTNGMVFVIGLLHNVRVTGLFSWGIQVSFQAVALLMLSLQQVLFPTLAKLAGEPERQRKAFCRVANLGLLLAVPLSLLQMIWAGPLVRLLFGEKWLAAVPVVVWLSLGMLSMPLSLLGSALLTARERNRTLALVTAFQAAVAILAALGGSITGGASEIAQWVGCATFLANLVPYFLASRSVGLPAAEALAPVRRLLLLAAALGGTALVLFTVLGQLHPWLRSGGATAGVLVAWLLSLLIPPLISRRSTAWRPPPTCYHPAGPGSAPAR